LQVDNSEKSSGQDGPLDKRQQTRTSEACEASIGIWPPGVKRDQDDFDVRYWGVDLARRNRCLIIADHGLRQTALVTLAFWLISSLGFLSAFQPEYSYRSQHALTNPAGQAEFSVLLQLCEAIVQIVASGLAFWYLCDGVLGRFKYRFDTATQMCETGSGRSLYFGQISDVCVHYLGGFRSAVVTISWCAFGSREPPINRRRARGKVYHRCLGLFRQDLAAAHVARSVADAVGCNLRVAKHPHTGWIAISVITPLVLSVLWEHYPEAAPYCILSIVSSLVASVLLIRWDRHASTNSK
jgi:hypothetical protein